MYHSLFKFLFQSTLAKNGESDLDPISSQKVKVTILVSNNYKIPKSINRELKIKIQITVSFFDMFR